LRSVQCQPNDSIAKILAENKGLHCLLP
jgi:hypothetical protein